METARHRPAVTSFRARAEPPGPRRAACWSRVCRYWCPAVRIALTSCQYSGRIALAAFEHPAVRVGAEEPARDGQEAVSFMTNPDRGWRERTWPRNTSVRRLVLQVPESRELLADRVHVVVPLEDRDDADPRWVKQVQKAALHS